MTARVSAANEAYIRRLAEFKAQETADERAKHRNLADEQRIDRGLRLSARRTWQTGSERKANDLRAFFQRAKDLGLYRP